MNISANNLEQFCHLHEWDISKMSFFVSVGRQEAVKSTKKQSENSFGRHPVFKDKISPMEKKNKEPSITTIISLGFHYSQRILTFIFILLIFPMFKFMRFMLNTI